MIALVVIVAVLLLANLLAAGVVLLLRVRSNRKVRRLGSIEAEWEPIIIGLIGGSDEAVPPVPDHQTRHVLEISGRFARRLRGPDRDRVREFARPLVEVLLENLDARSADKRASTIELLSVLSLDVHGEEIVAALDDPSTRVSFVAATALSQPDLAQYSSVVLDQLYRYSAWSPSLLSSMLARGGRSSPQDLRRYLDDRTKSPAARVAVAGALRLLNDPKACPIAARALDSDDSEIVVACLRLLAAVGTDQQADAVRGLLEHETFYVRAEALKVIGQIGSPADVHVIVRSLHHDSPWVAIQAANALRALGEYRVLRLAGAGDGLAATAAREVLLEGAS